VFLSKIIIGDNRQKVDNNNIKMIPIAYGASKGFNILLFMLRCWIIKNEISQTTIEPQNR